jgi:RsiW-degrading membrane proteinase PrsW (M82 family)
MVTCPSCEQEIPPGSFCVRCGAQLEGAASGFTSSSRRGFAAAPHQHRLAPSIVSSLFPQLPRAKMESFRLALGVGVAAVLILAVGRLYPVAVVVAAVVVPLLTVLYLYEVDVYEDEPVRVLAFTMAVGALGGVIVALIGRAVAPADTGFLIQSRSSAVVTQGLLLPALSVAAMMVGPLVLLPYRKFNDVLDGAIFGAASAVAFAGAAVITQAVPLLGAGLRPVGRALPWIYRLLELAVATPVLAAGVIGAAAGALWLRYRAPVRDRRALGWLGHPLTAVGVAVSALVAAALTQLYLSTGLALLVLIVLDALALIALRRVLHVGLLEESREIEIGPDIECPNCGQSTPHHTFCANCGVALGALPKGGRSGPPPETTGAPG